MFKTRLCSLLILLSGIAAHAQLIPKLNSISPEWIQRGTTADIIVTGENLLGITEFVFSGGEEQLSATISSPSKSVRLESTTPNVFSTGAANDNKRVTAKLTISSEAVLGSHEMRVISPEGVSNPLTIRVTDTPEIVEAGGKHSLTNAQEVNLPTGILGKVGEADQTDFFKFFARKNEHLIFDVQASRLGFALDSSLAILDSNGKELARNEDANGFDSFIRFEVPADGNYFLTIRDFEHRGGDAYNYHLAAGALPYVESIFPFGGQRGKTAELKLAGVNLEGAETMKMAIDPNAPGGPQEIRAHTAKGFSNPRQFDVSAFGDFTENEPNNFQTNANEVSVPGNINGHIEKEKDEDVFKFKVGKNQRFIFEIYASRFGSKLDPLITISDAKGNLLQRNDDAMGEDARIDQTFGEAGEYYISIRDLLGRNGENFGYRLTIDPPAPPDFSAKLLADTLRINRGGRTIARIEVNRGGFGGPIEISCDNLPKGISCEPLVIPADFPTGLLLLAANEDAETGSFALELKATGVLKGKKETRSVQPIAGSKPTVRNKRGRVKNVEGKAVGTAYLTVLESAPFDVDWVTLSANVEQNQSTKVIAEVDRQNGFNGNVKISVEGYSAANEPITKSLELKQVTLKTNETRAEISLTAKIDSETGTRPIFIRAEAKVDGQPVVEYSRPMSLRVAEFPFTLNNSLPRLAVTTPPPGATNSTASEAEFSVKAQRRGLFTDDINLAIEGLTEGVSATATNLLRGTGEAGFKLIASEKCKPGTNTLTVVGTADVNGRKFQLRAPGIQFIVNAPSAEANQTAAAK
jgi:hypothetical protein